MLPMKFLVTYKHTLSPKISWMAVDEQVQVYACGLVLSKEN